MMNLSIIIALYNTEKYINTCIETIYENNVLKYTIDLDNTYENFSPLYTKDTTKIIIKNKEELKKWNCE